MTADDNWHPHFGDLRNFEKTIDWCAQFVEQTPRCSIVLATDERTGSEWLCQMIGAAGNVGRPSEYLNEYWMRKFLPDYPSEVREQVRIARLVGTTSSGVFSMKLHPWHFEKLSRASMRLTEVFPAPVFVRLYRQDLLGQTISLVRARQTDAFHSISTEAGPAIFDADLIEKTMNDLARNRQRWTRFIARNDLKVLSISYEELVHAPQAALSAIGALVSEQINFDGLSLDRPLAIQRDAETLNWRERFVAERGLLDYLDD